MQDGAVLPRGQSQEAITARDPRQRDRMIDRALRIVFFILDFDEDRGRRSRGGPERWAAGVHAVVRVGHDVKPVCRRAAPSQLVRAAPEQLRGVDPSRQRDVRRHQLHRSSQHFESLELATPHRYRDDLGACFLGNANAALGIEFPAHRCFARAGTGAPGARLETQSMFTVGMYYDVNSWLKLVAEYNLQEDEWHDGTEREADVFALGGFFFW